MQQQRQHECLHDDALHVLLTAARCLPVLNLNLAQIQGMLSSAVGEDYEQQVPQKVHQAQRLTTSLPTNGPCCSIFSSVGCPLSSSTSSTTFPLLANSITLSSLMLVCLSKMTHAVEVGGIAPPQHPD